MCACACVCVCACGNSPVAELQTSHRGWQAVSTSLHLEAITHHHASALVTACPLRTLDPCCLSRSLHPRVKRNITDRARARSSVWLGAYTHLSLCHRRQSRNPASSILHVSRLRGTAMGSAYLFLTRVHRLPRLGEPHSEVPSSVIHSHKKQNMPLEETTGLGEM